MFTARYGLGLYIQFHVLPTQLYLCVLCGSQNKQPLFPYTALTDWFLGAVGKFRKAINTFFLSVCMSVRLSECNDSAPTGRIVTKFHVLTYFRISVQKI